MNQKLPFGLGGGMSLYPPFTCDISLEGEYAFSDRGKKYKKFFYSKYFSATQKYLNYNLFIYHLFPPHPLTRNASIFSYDPKIRLKMLVNLYYVSFELICS